MQSFYRDTPVTWKSLLKDLLSAAKTKQNVKSVTAALNIPASTNPMKGMVPLMGHSIY